MSDDDHHFAKIILFGAVSLLVIAFLIPGLLQSSFANETASLMVTVYHPDGTPAAPEDFVSSQETESQGYFSLLDMDGSIIEEFPTCNESESCEVSGLEPGDYVATISLGGEALTVGGTLAEYSEEVRIEESKLTELFITIEYGYAEIDITHLDGEELDPNEYVSEFGLVEGYYSLYDDEGLFVADAPSCNIPDESCAVILPAGIYTAQIVSPSSFTPYSIVIEVADKSLARETIEVQIGSFTVTVLDQDGQEADSSTFSHPTGYNELGVFAVHDSQGYLVIEAESCNISDNCVYDYDAGTYEVSIRRLAVHQVLSCVFEISDNNLTPIELYLSPPGCNQISTDSDSGNGNGAPADSGSNEDSNSNSGSGSWSPTGTNSGTTPTANPSSITNLPDRSVSIVSHSHYIDQEGFYHLVGEVMNTRTIAANEVVITSVFYSNSSNILAVKRTETLVDVLKPGDKAPFELVIRGIGISNSIESYKISAAYKNTTSTFSPSFLRLDITEKYYSNDTGLYHVEGKVYNHARSETSFVRLIVSAYDKDGIVVHVAQKYVTSLLREVSSTEFDISFIPSNASDIASVSAIVQSREYSMIPLTKLSVLSPTLDVTYASGIVRVNGTVPNITPESRYAVLYITWPDGYRNDKEVVMLSDTGYYEKTITFYAPNELKNQTFTVKTVYNSNFVEKEFIFT